MVRREGCRVFHLLLINWFRMLVTLTAAIGSCCQHTCLHTGPSYGSGKAMLQPAAQTAIEAQLLPPG